MFAIELSLKNKLKYTIILNERDDFLSTLDNFLKKHKLDLTDIKKAAVLCENKESMFCRIINSSIEAIKFKISNI